MRTNFKEIKDEVLGFYDEMLETVEKCEYSKSDLTLKELAVQAEKIKEDRFCLVIAGEAKSGKSTFINAYLGTEILPMDIKQCTSAVVEIAYGEEFCLKAIYADDRMVTITGETEINEFLQKHAALDDEYRDIPVSAINNELILKHKGRIILETEIQDCINKHTTKHDNLHGLSEEEYNKRIRKYIAEKQDQWRDLVVKIDIFYPFEDISMKGVRIIDTPGVNAAGQVGTVSEKYIESADAIMFLRAITGSAIEAISFKKFIEEKSVDRNKNVVFLVLTKTTSESEHTNERAYEEFVKIFGTIEKNARRGVAKEHIIPVDSKAELYFNKFKNMATPNIKEYILQLRKEKKAEAFLSLAWADACGDKDNLQEELKRISNFNVVDQALNKFGRKAQYIALSEFLGRVLKMYSKLEEHLVGQIKANSLKAEDPKKLAVLIEETQREIKEIENRINEKVDEITKKYAGSGNRGYIWQEAEKVMGEFEEEIKKLDADASKSIDALEKAAFRKVDKFIEFQEQLQKKVIAECNEVLRVALSDKNSIKFTSLEPDFTSEIVEKIKEEVKKESTERVPFESGVTFKKTEYISQFSQEKYYKLFRNSITERLELIKNQAVRELRSFVSRTANEYLKELRKNSDQKKQELLKIENDKKTADELQEEIGRLKNELGLIEPAQKKVEELKGGIDGIVQ